MSTKELRRVEIFGRVKAKSLSLGQAATLLGVSYRQTKRLWQRYQRRGPCGLQHQSVGRVSNRQLASTVRTRALALIRQKYSGTEALRFGPTLAAEHLASEDDVHVDHETLRRWMLAAGLWSPQRQRSPYRQRRERKAHFGELVQFDGSFHAWYEDRGPIRCLMAMVDDATSQMTGRFGDQETIWTAVAVLRTWITQHGVPHALYTDRHAVYVREATEAEIVVGAAALTQFGRMCAALDIRIIAAHSPQAKGRVERNHGTHQDRLVKKLRRLGIAADGAANQFLATTYWPAHNARFTQPASVAADFHRACPSAAVLDHIFRLEEARVIGQDWVVRYANRALQLDRQSGHAPARGAVTVCEWEDGRLVIEYRGQPMRWTEITGCRPLVVSAGPRAPSSPPAAARPRPRPGADHPWRHSQATTTTLWQAMKR